ncbi:MAG TPA: cell division FtsA domain-containing protein, partial [Nitrospiria bacterium]|nr:cell division FtsA domain-containing protein [Nitrospiria bacterium]
RFLSEIIESRAVEIFKLVGEEIRKNGRQEMTASGVVITGGSALMEGMVEIAERTLDLPVRVGYPIGVGGVADVVRSPMYATGVGLILHAVHEREKTENQGGRQAGMLGRVKGWMREIF